MLEFRSIFAPQKVLLITPSFDLGLKKKKKKNWISQGTETVIFFLSSLASLAIAQLLTLVKREEKLLQTEVL